MEINIMKTSESMVTKILKTRESMETMILEIKEFENDNQISGE